MPKEESTIKISPKIQERMDFFCKYHCLPKTSKTYLKKMILDAMKEQWENDIKCIQIVYDKSK